MIPHGILSYRFEYLSHAVFFERCLFVKEPLKRDMRSLKPSYFVSAGAGINTMTFAGRRIRSFNL